jgi:DNA polymerase-3 subunit gamma/tau
MYETLYRKYRPQTFADLAGQDAIGRTLRNAIVRDRVAHAYLFAGARGTGKTSVARILAKALNCLNLKDGDPCNACAPCLEIAAGGAVDILEIDAASNRGIDEIRDLREKVKYLPAAFKVKLYIVDEAHMLTAEAFNALLKTLEEPPRHVVFVLATTEPHKIPMTVLSRCQRFDFRRFDEATLTARLQRIAEAEGGKVAPEALALLARRAEGSMRDAISLLDQLLSTGAREVSLEQARTALGMADPVEVEALLRAILTHDPAAAMRQVARFYEAGLDVRELLRSLMETARGAALAATTGAGQPAADPRALVHVWDAALATQAELRKGGTDPRLALELVVLQLALGGESLAAMAAPARPAPVPAGAPAASAPPVPAAPPAAAGPPSQPGGPAGGEEWAEVKRRVNAVHKPAGALLGAAEFERVEDDILYLRFPTEMLSHKLEEPEKMRLVQQTLADVYGRPIQVRCRVGSKAPAPAPTRRNGPDEFVRDALSRFDATITRVTVLEGPSGPTSSS